MIIYLFIFYTGSAFDSSFITDVVTLHRERFYYCYYYEKKAMTHNTRGPKLSEFIPVLISSRNL